ncbi:MAG: hypothetical protein A2189_06655 [Paenibacillus sp. RIFOXYA1_FULL_44_5]|nr:MAG: hypothetical protein A2189_06655 [Paenibacillus sp. RIFOXYA1_FULL_44_5]
MKINPDFRSFNKEIKRSGDFSIQQAQEKSFSDLLGQQEEKSNQEQLQKMLNQVQEQGERLLRTMSIRELRAYKRLIQQFLEETARRGVGIKDTMGMDRRGRGKKYKLLNEIDGHLLQMADDLLVQEQGRVELLHHIGEIKGLLINFFY